MSSVNGGWGEYQRLVLAELERLSRRLDAIEKSQQEQDRKFYVLSERDIKELSGTVRDLSATVRAMERADIGSDAVQKYRKWILGGLLFLFTALVIPVIALVVSILNG